MRGKLAYFKPRTLFTLQRFLCYRAPRKLNLQSSNKSNRKNEDSDWSVFI